LTGDAEETRKPRIAILGSRGIPATYGGIETIAQEQVSELVKKGFEVCVSCESKRFKIKPYGNYQGVRLAYFPVIDSLRNLSRFQACMKLVQ
jgi:hypothetical protein